MNYWGKRGAVLALILMLAGVVVAAEAGPQLVQAGRAIAWYAPDNGARVLQAWVRPHILQTALTHPPTVHWLRWQDRYTALHEPVARQKLMHQVGGLLLLVLTVGLLVALWRLAGPVWWLLRGVGRLQPGTTQGSARFCTPREARHAYGPRSRGAPFVIGRVGHRRLWLSAKRQGLNILAVGVPGEGKSSALVIPNLLHETGRRSVVVADPKGECAEASAAALQAVGYTVQRLDFYDPDGAAYNPLAHVHTASEALAMARTWIRNTRGQGEVGASDEFWDSTAALMIVASTLHVNHLYRARTGQAAPLAALTALWNVEDYEELQEELLHSPCQEAQDAVRAFMVGLKMHGKLGGAVLVGLVVKFAVLNDPAVQKVTARDTLDFRVMGSAGATPLALFVTLTPGMEGVLQPLTACLFTQMFHELVASANTQPRKALPRPVFCYLDEAGTIGVIDGLPKRLATLRSAGVGLLLAVQDTVQLDTLYKPEGRRIITSTAQTHIIFAGVGQEDAAWVSTRLGTATVVGRSASAGRNRDELLVGQGGYNRSEVGRPLMTPEEIQQLPEGWMIVNALHARPVLARTLPWWKDRALKAVPPSRPTDTDPQLRRATDLAPLRLRGHAPPNPPSGKAS